MIDIKCFHISNLKWRHVFLNIAIFRYKIENNNDDNNTSAISLHFRKIISGLTLTCLTLLLLTNWKKETLPAVAPKPWGRILCYIETINSHSSPQNVMLITAREKNFHYQDKAFEWIYPTKHYKITSQQTRIYDDHKIFCPPAKKLWAV